MARVYIVMGSTGTGKSRSIKNLEPKETFVLNTIGKQLPFKGSGKMYSKENKNTMTTDSTQMVIKLLNHINNNSPEIKNVILDDIRYTMVEEFFDKAQDKGYEKFTMIGKNFQSILSTARKLREDLNVVLILHDDDKMSDGIIVEKKAKLVGKLVEDYYNPLEIVSCTLFTHVDFDKEGQPEYKFITNRTKLRGVTIPAKSPEEMFEDLMIPNDLKTVFEKAKEYYGG